MAPSIRELARSVYRTLPMKRQLFELMRRVPGVPRGLYQHLHFEGPFNVRIDPAHKFRIHSHGNYVENELFWRGFGHGWEGTSLRVWAALCRSRSGLAMDVGANTGVYALAAGALGQEVVAFEPVERMADRLRHNVALNRFAIEVVQMAVSDRTGRIPIYDAMTKHNYSASLEGQGSGAACYEVDVTSLDAFLPTDSSIAVVKIDVERHEPSVLRGMARFLDEQRPPLLVEILDRDIGTEVQGLIDGLGYRLFHIDERNGLVPTTAPGPLGDENWNHLICTDEQFKRVGLAALLAPSSSA